MLAMSSAWVDAERKDHGLLAKITESFLHIGVDREREAGFGDFRIFAGFEGLRGRFGGLGVFAGILAMIARRDIAAA